MARKFTDKEIKEGCRVVVNDKILPYPGLSRHRGKHGTVLNYEGDWNEYGVRLDDGGLRGFLARELDKEEQDGKAD